MIVELSFRRNAETGEYRCGDYQIRKERERDHNFVERFVLRHRGVRVESFSTLTRAKQAANGYADRLAKFEADVALAETNPVAAALLVRLDRARLALAEFSRASKWPVQYGDREKVFAAEIHLVTDVLVSTLGFDRTALSEQRGWGRLVRVSR
jgi:hypothetical protein